MKSIPKDKKKIFIAFAIILVIALLSTLIAKHVENKYAKLDSETRRAMTYEQVKETGNYVNYINSDGSTGDECKFIEFSAFFTRDLNGDGYAERLKGTCKDLSATDTLYAEVNVLTKGHLEKGQITLNADNFKWKTAIVADNIVEGDYIGETSVIRLKDQVQNGSQKLLWGTISQNVGNNINDYSKINSMTLTGTYVDDEGNRIDIEKTVDLTVDWYGTTNTAVNKYYYSTSGYSSYDNQLLDISSAIKEDKVEIDFKVAVSETNQTLLLQKQVAEVTIPELNGYKPTEVLVLDKNLEYNYDEETGKLTITRSSTVDEESGAVTNSISRSNINNVKVTYPLEAYDQISADSIVLSIPVVGYNYGYNNTNDEFENPHMSTAEGILTVTYSKPSGDIWNIYTTVGNYEKVYGNNYRYEISKEAVTNIYNGNVYEDETTTYPVRWEVVIGDHTAIQKLTLEEQKQNENNKTDEFLNTSGKYTSMYDYIKTTGIYFENASSTLGSNGWIKLYNAETGSLLETFTSSNWSSYTKEKPYTVDLKSIKVETSSPVANTTFNVYQIKEMDDELISQNFTEKEFESLSYIYTYLLGTIEAPDELTYEDGEKTSQKNRSNYAYYDMPYSVTKITVTPDQITNQKTENVNFVIDTISENSLERKWRNGVFLIELPENIINAEIKNVTVSDENVEISAYEVVENEGKQFIRIYTLNETEAIYTITVNTDITANPLKPTEVQSVKLYSYNENGDNYYSKTEDKYDIDADAQTNDYVGLATTSMTLIAPSGLLTTEYVTNYDDEGNTTIAPNVADIEKSTEERTATINVSVTNGYSGTISDVVILGKVPFEGNTYILNGESLNSEFTANITGAINVPEKLQENAVIYYSTNESPTKEISNESNGWKLAEDITDWKEIKTYLIDLQEYTLAKEENEVFTYEVKVPGGLGYNTVSYSDHAVYYSLDTENGKLAVQTEPNKVGIQVVAKYGLQLTKNKKAFDTMFVKGATYSITTTDADGNEITKTATTDKNGVLKFSGIYVERSYTLKEVSSPTDYVLSEDEVKFIAKINEQEELDFEIKEGQFKNGAQVTIDEKGNYLVTAEVEDEAKYTLVINKTDENGEKLTDVRFTLIGKGKNNAYRTDKNGVLTVTGLYPDVEYELQEIKADGYYIDAEARKFTVLRNEEGKLEITSEDEELKNAIINEAQGTVQADVALNIVNKKIPTYNLQILKVEENTGEEDKESEEKLTPLAGASFKLVSEDLGTQKEYITDKDGYITIPELHEYVEGKYITGKYTLQETKAPNGYSNNAEEINFKVTKNADDTLDVEIENEEKLTSFKSATIEENTLKIVVQDKPLFRITKVDSETGARLANAKFIIYELDDNGSEVDYAKDVNGDYVGEQNQYGEYIVTTDENGVISAPLRGGTYKIVEVGYPDGYLENSTVEIFKVNGNQQEEMTEEKAEEKEEDIVEIWSIEDLVELSNDVNAGNTYSGKTVKLMKTLSFTDPESYESKEVDESLITGSGFTPIGKNDLRYFSGVFDGQRNEIRNLYINIGSSLTSYAGLFGYVKNGEIKNLGVTGNISGSCRGRDSYAGGIAGYINSNSSISNCYNTGYVSSSSTRTDTNSENKSHAGGIAGYVDSSSISNCYNTGYVSGSSSNSLSSGFSSSYAGGIAGYVTNYSSISICYNTEDISSSGSYRFSSNAGGIAGYVYSSSISNSYNIGDINSSINAGGIVAYLNNNNNYNAISNCYYLETIEITAQNINTYGTSILDEDMKKEEFIEKLGKRFWKSDTESNNNHYPVLKVIDIEYITEIECIEDLIELYNIVNCGYTYRGKTVKLMKTLSFTDPESYKNKEVYESFINGSGFTPIGSYSNRFSGVFDGQGEKIEDIYINESSSDRYAGAGLFGYVQNGEIKNLGVTGEISSNNSYAGGIAGYVYSSSISNCYNTGTVSSSVRSSSYAGGIAGYISSGSSISNCYNTGEVSCSMDDTSGSSNAGGIAGYVYNSSSISNCYNTGNVSSSSNTNGNAGGIAGYVYSSSISNCYNTGTVSSSVRSSSYAGGIAGDVYSSSSISNCYNTGDISSSSSSIYNSSYAGGIAGRVDSSISNCYYLDTIEITGKTINIKGSVVAHLYMISKEFYNVLNVDQVWAYRNNDYPVLSNQIFADVIEATEITIENTIKKFKITTDVLEVNGVKGGEITGEDEEPYETVIIYNSNEKEIIMTPDTDYAISNITINGEQIDYEVNEDGTYTIPAGYFENIQEDKHVVVTYEKIDRMLIINKVDKNDNNKTLEGAKFRIDEDDRPEVTNEVGELTANGSTYSESVPEEQLTNEVGELIANGAEYAEINAGNEIPNVASNDGTRVLGNLTNNGTYYFANNGNTYKSNNKGVSSSVANSYMKIDLTGKTGNYAVVVNAQVSSESNYDFGYATITQTTTAPSYDNSTGQFIKISGTTTSVTTATDYTSGILQGGNVYYLHLGYRKDGSGNTGDDTFIINSVKVYETIGTTTYNFDEIDGKYVSNNQGENNTVANSYIPIDLRNLTGKYNLVVNAEISSQSSYDYGYVTVTESTTAPTYNSSSGRIIYMSGTQSAKDYTTTLTGGKMYYVHLGYYKDPSTSSGTDTFTINSIELYGTEDVTYNFDGVDGKYVSNNQGKDSTVANSYIPIDLTNTTGKYNLTVNAEISSGDYGYVTVTENTTAPAYNSSSGRIIYISGTQSAKDYTTILTGGKKYYVHLGYYKDAYTNSGTDTFTINSVELSLNKDDFFYREFTTNEYGQISAIVPADTTFKITELEAPQGYTLNSETITYTMKSNEENILTITNKRKTALTVHHYLKQNDGTYTDLKVAEDELQEGDIGEDYTTSPKIDLENLTLEKVEGTYVIPSNATGTFTEEPIEVTYYYEMQPINLTINHYINGTDIKLADEKTENFDSEITFNEDGTYTVTTKGSYEINTNDDYKDLIKSYELVKIESSVTPTLNSDDTLEFTENTELRYYYQLKDNIITTEVKEHTENRTNPLTNTKEETKVKGGTITGEDQAPYETVEDGKDSTKEITAIPDKGYTIKQIILQSINRAGDKTETIIYGEEQDENAEISYKVNEDGSITLVSLPKDEENPDGEQPGGQNPNEDTHLFENVTENKHIIVEFEPILSKIVVHHYMVETGEEYRVDPVYPLLKDETEAPNEEKQDFVGEPYATKSNEDIKDIYKLVAVSGDTSGTFVENEVKHIYYYYDYNDYAYEIHYFYDGVEDETKVEYGEAKYGEIISEYPDKPEGYVFNKVTPANPDDKTKANLQITEDNSKNIINVYYIPTYEITTDVIEHTENYKNGTTKTVKGGTITGEDETPHEEVTKYENNEKAINIVPDEGYEITKVTITTGSESVEINVEDYVDENGRITFAKGYFKNVQNNINIDVEFRKKTSVTIKYLEEGTKEVLATEERVVGIEGEKYQTSRKPIQKYEKSSLGVTYEDENLTKFDETKDNIMYADEYTIIYWYKKLQSEIIVRHIEINENDKKQGLTLDSGIELDEETFKGNVDDIKETSRKTENTDEKYKNYISVDGPTTEDENIIIVGKDENSKQGTYKENEVVEIRYYYERQYNITTEVKPHDEQKVNTETGKTENVQVDGGTISGNGQDSYEKVLNKGSNKEAIVITPENKYQVKQVTVNDKQIDITNLENENHIVTIPTAYFKEVDENKHIVVEFEKIPTKVIVEYRDVDTKEEIKENKTIGGVVDDEYKTTRSEIKDYITAEPEPTNSEGIMTEETITVTYWYTKQFKITTDVIDHLEEINGEFVSKKGGEITGEDLLPYETVNRGKNNTLAITMKPEKGYRIAEIKINGKTLDYSNHENIIITEEVIDNVTQKTVEIPVEYFKDMQEDKHITVSYERIPTKVIVKYLEDGTDKPLADETNEYGYVYDKYETKEKDIEYYELVKEKYPENSTGTYTEDAITVKYYYKKLKFNMKVEKEIGSITLNGENVELTSNNKLANIKIDYKDINETNLEITYKIKVTNTEKVAGTATIEELIPEGFEFVVDKSDMGWKLENGRYILEAEEIKPGETKEYSVTLKWIQEENNKGQKTNTAKIADTNNIPNYEETTKEDNEDGAEVNIQLNKTIKEIIGDIADGKIKDVVKDVVNNVKTGDTIAISVLVLAVAGIVIVMAIVKKNKSSKEDSKF